MTEQQRTLEDAKNKLQKKHKVMVIRPTGFGKTWLLTELIRNYKSVLYLYPSAVIKNTVVDRYYDLLEEDEENCDLDPETIDTYKTLNTIPNCTLMTYAKLARLENEKINEMKFDLIVFDEAHRLGGARTKLAVEKLMKKLGRKADYIGATATPTRMDNFDVTSHFFNDITCYIFTMYDAIRNNLLKKPYYCYCSYDFKKELTKEALRIGEDVNDAEIQKIIDAKVVEMAHIYNLPNVIKSTCDEYAVNTNYLKFIVFFSSFRHIDDQLDEVKSWFHEAYPKHKINTLTITSRNKEEATNVDKLETLKAKKKTIDIIACINMMNVGYHVNDLTGILMYRGTTSSTIFIQQLGRALSVGQNNSAIVFDVVDNLHRKAVFELKSSLTNKQLKNKTPKEQHEAKQTDYKIGDDGKTLVIHDEKTGEIIESQYHIDEDDIIRDEFDNPATIVFDRENDIIYDAGDEKSNDINKLTKECITATGHAASEREFIAKAMAEPAVHRCRFAQELHFRSWCYKNNIPYPITDEDLEKMHNMSKEDYYKEFCKIVKANKLDYNIQDAKEILQMGKDDDQIPLSICAQAVNTSINAMLDLIYNRPDLKS